MDAEYVKKDVHDANMAEIRALMAASEARQKEMITEVKANNEIFTTEFRGELKNANTRLDGVVDGLLIAIDGIKEAQNKTLTTWGIIVAVIVGIVQIGISLWFR